MPMRGEAVSGNARSADSADQKRVAGRATGERRDPRGRCGLRRAAALHRDAELDGLVDEVVGDA